MWMDCRKTAMCWKLGGRFKLNWMQDFKQREYARRLRRELKKRKSSRLSKNGYFNSDPVDKFTEDKMRKQLIW